MATDADAELVYLRQVGLRVKLARVTRRLSRRSSGRPQGCPRVTVGSIERGDHPASVLAYRRLARTFGVPVSELLDVDE